MNRRNTLNPRQIRRQRPAAAIIAREKGTFTPAPANYTGKHWKN